MDEYEDDEDPGFQRMDVVGQEAALGCKCALLFPTHSSTSGTSACLPACPPACPPARLPACLPAQSKSAA